MKKSISLLLVIVLALTFVLASCGAPEPCETHTDENEDGICDVCSVIIPPADLTIFDLFEYDESEKEPASISKVVTFEFEGQPSKTTDKILITRDSDTVEHDITPNNPDDDQTVEETIYVYHVYSLVTGKQIIEYTERPNWSSYRYLYPDYDSSTDTKIRGISFLTPGDQYGVNEYLPEGYYAVSVQLWNGKGSIALCNEDGAELVNATNDTFENVDVAIDFFGDDHFVFLDVLYRVKEDGTATKVVDTKITDLYNRYDQNYYSFFYIDGNYFAIENVNNDIENVTVFDGSFNAVKYVTIPERYDMSKDAYLLSNGNIFVRYEKEIPVLYLLPEDTYDYTVNGMALTYDDVIINTETGEVTDIEDLPLAELSIYAIALYDVYKEDVADNMIIGCEIVDGVVSGETTYYSLTNDGAIKDNFVGFDGFDHDDAGIRDAISADTLVVETPVGTYLYKADGTKIGMFPGNYYDAEISDKYIKYGNDIYDFSLTKVFTIDEDMEYVTFANDAIYYAKYTEQVDEDYTTEVKEYVDGYYTWYVWNGANKELVKIYDDDAARTGFYAFNNGYVIKSYTEAVEDNAETADVDESVPAKTTYTFYTSAGVKVDEIVETETTTTKDGKTTVVTTQAQFSGGGGDLEGLIEVITTTVTEVSGAPEVTITYKVHFFW